VAPRTAYYYRARVVAQATKPEPGEITVVDGKPVRLVLPKDIAELPREAPGGRLFASAWTPVASATTAPHYRVRFTGTADPVAHDQARAGGASEAFFAVRVWRKEAPGWTEAHIKVRPGAPLSGTLPIKDAKLWSPEAPYLYTARLTLLRGPKAIDTVTSRFGLRQIEIRGPHFLLNGKRLFLRGYGDDHIYPRELARSADKEMYRSRLRLIKSYGFNFVRHHSTIMPPEYYEDRKSVV
jgi:hypothetical protein